MLIQSLLALSLLTAPVQDDALTAEGQAIETAIQAYAAKTNDQRREIVVAQLREQGFAPQLASFQGGNERTGPRPGANVVVTVGEGDKDIVLTAHFDAVPLRDGSMSQGVVDNAGSVAALMEAAGLIKAQVEQAPGSYRYVFVFTDQEELGLIGARKWLEMQDKSRIHAVINMDVNAYGETLMYGENVGEASAFVLRAMRTQCAERAFDCVAFPNYPPSDDRVFSALGLPVISIGSQDAVGAHQMWLAFNGGQSNGLAEGFVPPVFQRIHSADDRMEWVDGDDILRTATFVADLALRLARDE
ncbi:M28 family metallopeptidase [Brevundimonas sp. M20]|uniref:M28 family metallopeptidase n=1 Tax=Brevundimonas sp. M20 TaxID=2591463 RepID=UPI001146D12B|nr:M20/M25/M40 family metallo-hydrolase [Brevundimonas sp. M20]QDH74611.1 Zn-dependent exopeptidase M28 [Brevundimonas sp. M20]